MLAPLETRLAIHLPLSQLMNCAELDGSRRVGGLVRTLAGIGPRDAANARGRGGRGSSPFRAAIVPPALAPASQS